MKNKCLDKNKQIQKEKIMNNAFIENLEVETNSTMLKQTENMALGFAKTKSPLVDLLFSAGSARKMSEDEINILFSNAFLKDKELALRLMLYLRDAREGVGERRLFNVSFRRLIKHDQNLAIKFIEYIPEYGSWKDLIKIIENFHNNELSVNDYSEVFDKIIEVIDNQLTKDIGSETPSLLAKWLPTINASSIKTRNLAKYLVKHITCFNNKNNFERERAYRKALVNIRKKLDVVEVKMSSKNWSEIDYSQVPSLANLKYSKAFLKNDYERRKQFLEDLHSKVKPAKVKINTGVLMPHEIVSKFNDEGGFRFNYEGWFRKMIDLNSDEAKTYEAMWKSLSEKTPAFNKNMLVVRDGSGSMMCNIGSGKTTALDVATALSIFCAEHNTGPWHNKFMTFSYQPRFITLPGISLGENLKTCYKEDEVSNTDIYKVFEKVLNTAKVSKLKQEEIPDILIISDMEFDSAVGINSYNSAQRMDTLFENISNLWSESGYDLPKLIFWNVNSRTKTIPINENKNGVILLGGFSQNLLQMVLGNELDPLKQLMEVINVERYDIVSEILSK